MAWKFEDRQGRVRLVNYFTGKTFQLQGLRNADAVVQEPVVQSNATFQAWKFVALPEGLFRLDSPGGEGAMTAVDSDGHGDIRVVVKPWAGQEAQKWELVPLPDHFTA